MTNYSAPRPFTAIYRSDKRKAHPQRFVFRFLTLDEIKAIKPGDRVLALDQHGQVAHVKITSIKTWKTRPDIEVHWKFGLREFGTEIITPPFQQRFFLAEQQPVEAPEFPVYYDHLGHEHQEF